MLQFHGSLAEISSAIEEAKKRNPHDDFADAYIYYLTCLWNYRYWKANGWDKEDVERLGKAATLACIEFNKILNRKRGFKNERYKNHRRT